MNPTAWGLLGVTLALAVLDWWGVWTERRPVRLVAKPLTLVALIAVALALDPFSDQARALLVAGLVCSLAGDVFLLFEERFFVAGLGSFLLGHVLYVAALFGQRTSWAALALGALVVAVAIGTVGRRIVAAVRAGDHPELTIPVVAYLLVISAMVISAFGTAVPAAILGAMLFYASDATLAWNRFVQPLRFGGIAVMVTYHLGQIGLVAWLVTG